MKEIFPLLLIALAFVLLMSVQYRARNREVRKVQEMQSDLAPGVRVMTSSGVYGDVVRVTEDAVELEIAPGVVTTWAKLAIREIKTPAGPAEPAAVEPAAKPAADEV